MGNIGESHYLSILQNINETDLDKGLIYTKVIELKFKYIR